MAGIEKVCECGKDDCVYHGGDMWKYKHNHLQINPECRYQFKDKFAKIFILNTKLLNSDWYYAYSQWGTSYGRLQKEDDVCYDGVLYNEAQYKRIVKPYNRYHLTPIRKVHQYEVAVVVGEQVFYNTIWDLRKFKLNMKKMFNDVQYVSIRKDVAKGFNSAYDLFKGIGVEGGNSGFDNMINYVAKAITGETQ